MARPEGFEPPTPGSEVPCSILLSYGRTILRGGKKFSTASHPTQSSVLYFCLSAVIAEVTEGDLGLCGTLVWRVSAGRGWQLPTLP
jgi:hypothetical protein